MRAITLASAGIPSVPTIGTAVAGDAGATVTFTPSTYLGKSGVVIYEITSSPGNLSGTGASSPIILGLTNGVSYTFTVKAVTNYGVSSAVSSSSNSVTPAAPPVPPPGPPPPPPCTCNNYNGQNCVGDGSNCGCVRVFPNTCDGQVTYEYYDCGCAQTCPGTGGYNGAYIIGSCGYTGPPGCGTCGSGGCFSNGCGGTVCYDGCGECSNSGCAAPPPPSCPDCPGVGPCCAPLACVYSEIKQSNVCG